MINLAAASHDTAHWGHVGARASCGVLDRMAGGWRGVLGMGYIKLPPRTDKTGSCYQELFIVSRQWDSWPCPKNSLWIGVVALKYFDRI